MKSYVPISFIVGNGGETSLVDCSVIFSFPKDVELSKDNVIYKAMATYLIKPSKTYVNSKNKTVILRVGDLNPQREIKSDEFFVKIPLNVDENEIYWSLSASDYHKEGTLKLINKPHFKVSYIHNNKFPGKVDVKDDIEIKTP